MIIKRIRCIILSVVATEAHTVEVKWQDEKGWSLLTAPLGFVAAIGVIGTLVYEDGEAICFLPEFKPE